MIDFIKKIESDFDIEINQSSERVSWKNTFDLDQEGNIRSLYLYGLDFQNLDILLPISEHIKELWLQDCSIQRLNSLKNFNNLTKLCLDSNPLLPNTFENICFLSNLIELKLEETPIEDTSHFITLSKLEKLSVGFCQKLKEVKGLEELKSLNHLDLNFSQIESAENIHVQRNLQSLNISNSGIRKISGLDYYPFLKTLELSGNPITKIDGLKSLKSLKRLMLSSAFISRMEGLESLINLETLDLSNNCYGELDKINGLDNLINIKRLNLSENKIQKVENLDKLVNLEYLLLECNDIRDLDKNFLYTLKNKCHISLVGNPIKELGIDIPQNLTIQFEEENWIPKKL